MVYEYSDIDYPPSHNPIVRGAEADYFSLFEFSAKYDPVPTMLTQNHMRAFLLCTSSRYYDCRYPFTNRVSNFSPRQLVQKYSVRCFRKQKGLAEPPQ